jgi:hypothetical protein
MWFRSSPTIGTRPEADEDSFETGESVRTFSDDLFESFDF